MRSVTEVTGAEALSLCDNSHAKLRSSALVGFLLASPWRISCGSNSQEIAGLLRSLHDVALSNEQGKDSISSIVNAFVRASPFQIFLTPMPTKSRSPCMERSRIQSSSVSSSRLEKRRWLLSEQMTFLSSIAFIENLTSGASEIQAPTTAGRWSYRTGWPRKEHQVPSFSQFLPFPRQVWRVYAKERTGP